MKIVKTKEHKKYMFIRGFIKLIDAILPIITLGNYWTDLEYKYVKSKYLF